MKAVTGLTGALLTVLLAGCSAPQPVPAPHQAAVPTTLLEQLGEQVTWLRNGACHGDRAATLKLSRAVSGAGMAAGDFTWVRGLPREPLTQSGLLGGLHDTPLAGQLMLSCAGRVPG